MLPLKTLAILTLGLSVVSPAAFAADYIAEPVYVEPEPLAAASNWYIRGDVGYVSETETSGEFRFYNALGGPGGQYEGISYDEVRHEEALMIGGGLGYQFSEFARFDVTADYFSGDLRGSTRCANGSSLSFDCRYDDKSELETWIFMANAYLDIGHYGRFTPYIGVGAGAAHVSYGELDNDIVCASGPCEGTVVFNAKHEGYDSWRFASSLYAGTAIDLMAQLKLDVGYRYTRIFEGDAFGFDPIDRAAGASGVQGTDHGYDIHAFRAGLRYSFH